MSYQPPKSPLATPAEPPFNPLWLLVGLGVSSVAGIVSLLLAPSFERTFAAFGASLPRLTRWLLDYPWAPCLLPLAVLAFWATASRQRRDRWACALGVVAGLAAIALVVVALYLPIVVLSSTI